MPSIIRDESNVNWDEDRSLYTVYKSAPAASGIINYSICMFTLRICVDMYKAMYDKRNIYK